MTAPTQTLPKHHPFAALPEPDAQAHIAQLWVYPIKSCAGIALQQAHLLEQGLQWDRHWMLVDEAGRFCTQREWPRMVLIQPQLVYDHASGELDHLLLQAPGMPALQVPARWSAHTAGASVRTVQVWRDSVPAHDVGDATAAWFSYFLGHSVRLVAFDPAQQRLCSTSRTEGWQTHTRFSDGYPLLLTTDSAAQALHEDIVQHSAGQGTLPAVPSLLRFRPNIVLSDLPAHEEDYLCTLWTGTATHADARLQLVKPCVRCPIPNIDPQTAQGDPAVGDALLRYRRDARMDGAPTFGMNAVVLRPSATPLHVGQTVWVGYGV
ncbi:MOSC N-terminal beta barrel domain-containing protein [Curvibacter sp. CHRR-16]|uniref:MOSC domain-containing protein n=1 Tax=Curvibacter sp. CHRR-16 TaxID=2835872 RepID=UPI001BD96BFA|nr:MOSC N-terminal beta barrel domain-containing protein [Curvibacter sp. CHRR-16]MBT0570984.1 MOSC N-terminal beta barrel domain-containing protein [Curvibacter sp. CHRR-16]